MKCLNRIETSGLAANQYVTSTYFCHLFIEEMADLHQLSFILTADHDKAEQCFVAALEDCVKTNHVFREWACSWAKRNIIQNAILMLQPRPGRESSTPTGQSQNWRTESLGDFEVYRVLALEDFERFVFVMSVLEHYSEHECALLLGCSQRQVLEARSRALVRLPDFSFFLLSHENSFDDLQETNR